MKKQASYELSMKNTGRQTSLSSANTSVMLLYVVGSQESRWSFQFYIRTKIVKKKKNLTNTTL